MNFTDINITSSASDYVGTTVLSEANLIKDFCMQWDGKLAIIVVALVVMGFILESLLPYLKEKFGIWDVILARFGTKSLFKSIKEGLEMVMGMLHLYMLFIVYQQGLLSYSHYVILIVVAILTVVFILRTLYRRLKGKHKGETSFDDFYKTAENMDLESMFKKD